jgi:hypothetical protein
MWENWAGRDEVLEMEEDRRWRGGEMRWGELAPLIGENETDRLCVGESVDKCTPEPRRDGSSPKIKNLMKKLTKMTTESCPTRKPCVKDRLIGVSL